MKTYCLFKTTKWWKRNSVGNSEFWLILLALNCSSYLNCSSCSNYLPIWNSVYITSWKRGYHHTLSNFLRWYIFSRSMMACHCYYRFLFYLFWHWWYRGYGSLIIENILSTGFSQTHTDKSIINLLLMH